MGEISWLVWMVDLAAVAKGDAKEVKRMIKCLEGMHGAINQDKSSWKRPR